MIEGDRQFRRSFPYNVLIYLYIGKATIYVKIFYNIP